MQCSRSVLWAVFLTCCSFYHGKAYVNSNDSSSTGGLLSSQDLRSESLTLVNDSDDTVVQPIHTINQDTGKPILRLFPTISKKSADIWRSGLYSRTLFKIRSRKKRFRVLHRVARDDVEAVQTEWQSVLDIIDKYALKLIPCLKPGSPEALQNIASLKLLFPANHGAFATRDKEEIIQKCYLVTNIVTVVLNKVSPYVIPASVDSIEKLAEEVQSKIYLFQLILASFNLQNVTVLGISDVSSGISGVNSGVYLGLDVKILRQMLELVNVFPRT